MLADFQIHRQAIEEFAEIDVAVLVCVPLRANTCNSETNGTTIPLSYGLVSPAVWAGLQEAAMRLC